MATQVNRQVVQSATLCRAAGDELMWQGHLSSAIAHYKESLRFQADVEVCRRLGDLLAQVGQLEEAQEYYRQAGQSVALLDNPVLRQTLALDRLVVIYYYGRSGSVFLQSLLDNHPQVVTAAGPYLQNIHVFWEQYGQLPKEDFLRQFYVSFAPIFDATVDSTGFYCPSGRACGLTTMGPDRDVILRLDESRFRQHLVTLVGPFQRLCRRYFFQAVHAAYWLSFNDSLGGKEVIVHQFHNGPARGQYTLLHKIMKRPDPYLPLNRLMLDFPAARHVHMVRQPLKTLASHFAAHTDPSLDANFPGTFMRGADAASKVLSLTLLGGEPVTPEAAPLAVGVRLEDLHEAGEATTRKLAEWLDLPWDDSLLSSTFQGVQWWNVVGAPVVSGFNKAVIQQDKSSIYNGLDNLRLKVLLATKFRRWGYDLPWLYHTRLAQWLILPLLWVPFRMEIKSWKNEWVSGDPLPTRLRRWIHGYLHLHWTCLRAWGERINRVSHEFDVLEVGRSS